MQGCAETWAKIDITGQLDQTKRQELFLPIQHSSRIFYQFQTPSITVVFGPNGLDRAETLARIDRVEAKNIQSLNLVWLLILHILRQFY